MKKHLGSAFLMIKAFTFSLLLAMGCFAQTETKLPSDFQTLKKTSVEEVEIKTTAHDKLRGLGKADRWDLDQEKGDLIFSFDDGIKAVAPAQIIGTYNSKDGTWLWAWANPSIDKALKKDAIKVREYGEKHRIEQLTKAKWAGTQEDAWAMAALAVKLCGAQGAYRGSAGAALYVFMTFGEVKLNKQGTETPKTKVTSQE
jgi:hypothetical protein